MDTGIEKSPKLHRNMLLDSCRVCMAQNSDMTCVFDPAKNNLGDKIYFCTGISLSKDDGLPTNVCNKCVEDLTIAHKFKSSCLLADETFRRVLENSVKTEPCAVDDDDGFDDYSTLNNVNTCDENKIDIQVMLKNIMHNRVKISKSKIKIENNESTPVEARRKRGPYKKKNPLGSKEGGKAKRPYSRNGPKIRRKNKFTKLTCIPCSLKFKTKAEFEEHKASNHSNETERFVCEICGKVFVHRASHYSHVKVHLPPSYACAHCDYRSVHKYDLVKHVRIHTGMKQYQCEICPRSYYTSSNLMSHIRAAHQLLRPHHCTLCPKTFFDRTKLNRHIDSHNDIKRFQCDVCHSGFTRRCYWKKHLERQHSIVIPPMRPGRQKMDVVIGDNESIEAKSTVLQMANAKPYVRPRPEV